MLQKGFFVSNFRALVLRCCFCVCRRCGFLLFGRIALTQQIKLSNHAWKNKLSIFYTHDTNFALSLSTTCVNVQIEAKLNGSWVAVVAAAGALIVLQCIYISFTQIRT